MTGRLDPDTRRQSLAAFAERGNELRSSHQSRTRCCISSSSRQAHKVVPLNQQTYDSIISPTTSTPRQYFRTVLLHNGLVDKVRRGMCAWDSVYKDKGFRLTFMLHLLLEPVRLYGVVNRNANCIEALLSPPLLVANAHALVISTTHGTSLAAAAGAV
jgi:hypothetical protein